MITSQELATIAEKAGAVALAQQEKGVHDSERGSYAEEKAAFSELDAQLQEQIWDAARAHGDLGVIAEEVSALRGRTHENELKSGRYTLIVDSLDGTRNYLKGSPYWGVSLTLAHGTECVATAVAYPRLDLTLRADATGVFLNDRQVLLGESTTDDIHVSGALKNTRILSKYPPTGVGSAVVTILGLLKGNGADIPGDFPTVNSYVGGHGFVHDMAPAFLVWPTLGGLVVDHEGNPTNLLENLRHDKEQKGVIVEKEFVLTRDKHRDRLLEVLR